MMLSAKYRTLLDLPNLSVLMCEALQEVGIRDSNTLHDMGAEKTWLRLHRHPVHSSAQSLLALEGAIRGIDWHDVPYVRRLELERFALEHEARQQPPSSFPRPS